MTAQRVPADLPPPLWTPAEVMAHLRCSRRFLFDHKAELGARKMGRDLRFDPACVLAFGTIHETTEDAPTQVAPAPKLLPFDRRSLPPRNPLDGSRWPWDREAVR